MYIRQEERQRLLVQRFLFLLVLYISVISGIWLVIVAKEKPHELCNSCNELCEPRPELCSPCDELCKLHPMPTATRDADSFANEGDGLFYDDISTGDIFFAEGRVLKAISVYQQAIDLNPNNDLPYSRQAQLLVYHGAIGQALIQAEKAVLLNPTNPDNLATYCWALDWEGHYGKALQTCQCALEFEPNHVLSYAYLTEIYTDISIWDKATEMGEMALSLDPNHPDVQHNMGYLFQRQAQYEQATEHYEQAISLKPNQAWYYQSAGRNYFLWGKYDEAIKRFRRAIRLAPVNALNYDRLGWTYYSDGDPFRAIDALEQGIQADPYYARTWGRLATIYFQRQNYEQAINIFPKAIAVSEYEFLSKVRNIEITIQIQGKFGTERLPILRGQFERDVLNQSDTLSTDLTFVEMTRRDSFAKLPDNCADEIVYQIKNPDVEINISQEAMFTQVFSQSNGTATLDMISKTLTLDLTNIPSMAGIPYEVQLNYQHNKSEIVGYVIPHKSKRLNTVIAIPDKNRAPLEYYYTLGLVYTYLNPPECESAIPWLIKAVNKEPAAYNPAWHGFNTCPTNDIPLTPTATIEEP